MALNSNRSGMERGGIRSINNNRNRGRTRQLFIFIAVKVPNPHTCNSLQSMNEEPPHAEGVTGKLIIHTLAFGRQAGRTKLLSVNCLVSPATNDLCKRFLLQTFPTKTRDIMERSEEINFSGSQHVFHGHMK